jgi:hypothetical protein
MLVPGIPFFFQTAMLLIDCPRVREGRQERMEGASYRELRSERPRMQHGKHVQPPLPRLPSTSKIPMMAVAVGGRGGVADEGDKGLSVRAWRLGTMGLAARAQLWTSTQ